ncbi:hypothetical protein ANCCAN_08258 [Ancylostoma caninum]|uniref:Paired domain-containing protein n=1 Tax=Ancylostoma caninum TaxID=29170 RepID=A0A368GRK7_ANCCA|nr:hypothetical protein ANCCAN_08258 [Ancylostoma caninum]
MVKRSCHHFSIIEPNCESFLAREIHQRLGVHQSVIRRSVRRYKDLGTDDDRSGRGRHVSVTTTSNLGKVRGRNRLPRMGLQKGWNDLDAPYLCVTVDAFFPKRLKACIDVNGDIFKFQSCF